MLEQIYWKIKILKKLDKIEADKLFTFNTQDTRGHKFKFFKKNVRTDFGKLKLRNRVVNDWNSLPSSVVEAISINDFKNKLDHYLRHTRGLR